MANFRINGSPIDGQIYELKPNTLAAAEKQGKEDGLDQIYFEADSKLYVLEGDGLDLSPLDTRELLKAQLKLGDTPIKANILAVDNEVNTAGEGVKSLGKAIGGALIGGALGGSTMMLLGHRGLQAGSQGLASSAAVLSKGLQTVSHLKALPYSVVEGAAAITAKEGSMMADLLKNQPLSGISTKMKTSHAIVMDKGLSTVEGGMNQVKAGIATAHTQTTHAAKNLNLVKSGLKVVAIGAAIAGTLAVGGALYGAYRGEDEHSLDALKTRRVN